MNTSTTATEKPALHVSFERELSSYGQGSLIWLGGLVGISGLIALGYIGWRQWQGWGDHLALIPACSLAVFAGLLSILMHRHYRRRLSCQFTFDREAGLVTYQQAGHTGQWQQPIRELRKLLVVEETAPSAGRFFRLYLVWQDGACWWLRDCQGATEAREQVEEIIPFLDIPIDDHSSLGLGRMAAKQFKAAKASYDLKPSGYLREARLHGTLGLRLLHPHNWRERLILSLLLFWLMGTPVWLLYQGWLHNLGTPSLYWASGVILFLVATIVSLFIVYQKSYTLLLRPGGLQVEMGLGVEWIDKWIGQKWMIPKSQIWAVRLHRLPGGRFWLSLVLDPEVQTANLRRFVLNAGVLAARPDTWPDTGEVEVGLWEVPPAQTPKAGPYLGDILALKRLIERQYLKDLHDICD